MFSIKKDYLGGLKVKSLLCFNKIVIFNDRNYENWYYDYVLYYLGSRKMGHVTRIRKYPKREFEILISNS